MKKIFKFIVVLLAIVLTVWANTYYRQFKYYKKAEKAMENHEYLNAIAFYESSIRMYTPCSKLVKKSVHNIITLAEKFEKNGDFDKALIAYRSLKTSLYAIRNIYSPYSNYRTSAEKKIIELLAEKKEITSQNAQLPEITETVKGEHTIENPS